MRYRSTRGEPQDPSLSFTEILLAGLAPDGGLYMPEHYPHLSEEDLLALKTVFERRGYPGLACAVMSLYIDDIPHEALQRLCVRAYSEAKFSTAKVAPVSKIDEGTWMLHLSNGPTAAFKDMAMQMLGQLFEYVLAANETELNILGATSGDTGSSAEYAMLGKKNIRVFMLTPAGRMTPFQQAQMFGIDDPRIINVSLDGVFDDCQDVVKAVSADARFKRRYSIGAVNSINWARLLAQVVYYVAAWIQVSGDPKQPVSFSVPTGNFGDVCAGHVARSMGVPIEKLVVATNENDVLDEFFRTGVYRVRSSAETLETSSPSMDISKASNFERFVFDLLGRDTGQVRELFGSQLNTRGYFDLSAHEAVERAREEFGFYSGSSTHADRLRGIAEVHRQHGVLMDPHTADAWNVSWKHLGEEPMIVLETALPVKFADTIEQAVGFTPKVPRRFVGIEKAPRHVTHLPKSVDSVKNLIRKIVDV